MKIAILIFAHKNESQLKKLIEHLKVDFDLYIHIDKKSKFKMDSFDNVSIYKKFNVAHGGYSQIMTSIFLLKEAFQKKYDRYIFISGQDLPLKSNNYIIDFFNNAQNKDKEFILAEEVCSNDGLYNNMCRRMNTYNFGFWYRKFTHQSVRMAVSNLPLLRRTLAKNMYFGSSWFNITHSALNYILEYIEENIEFLKRFEHTWGGDELFFNTILMNSDFKNNCVSDNVLRFMAWNGGVPNTLLINDYEVLKNSDALFARKFDEKIDNEIIEKLYFDIKA